ncbi:MAG: ABC transporter substrate-binding protein [Acidimicrobiales bacterium]|nr:ABC transporter substrate-binding protein [Acidimicrobiales bacterium]
MRAAPRHRLLAVMFLVFALLAAACGGDDGGDDQSGATTTPADSDGGGDDGGDDGGDSGDGATITVATPGVVSSLDSERYQGFISIDLLPNLAGTLLRFEEPEQGAEVLQQPDQLEGELAESWEVSEDRSSATFTLREGVVSNLGNPLTSEDVAWSIERMINSEGVPIARILMEIGGWDLENPIEVIDDRTFTLNFAAPNAVSLTVLTTFFMTIYDSEGVMENATEDDQYGYEFLANNTASFGPYEVESFDPGNEVRLVANPNYHRGMPEVTDVVVRAVSEGSSRLQLAQRGEVDIAMALTFDQIESLQTDDAVRLEQVLYPNIDTIIMNVESEPFDDVRVRQAVAYALDREAILEGAYSGIGSVATDFFHDAFGVESIEDTLEHDPERSRELLAEAGLADGFDMTIAYNVANLGAHIEQVAVLIQSQLAEVGIDVELQNIPSGADFDAAKRDGTLSAWLATSLPLVPDPAYYLQVFYATDGLTNLHNYSTEEVDTLSRQILETQPGEERDELITEVNEFMIEDMASAPIVDTQKFYIFQPSVTGFRSYPQGHIHYWDLSVG